MERDVRRRSARISMVGALALGARVNPGHDIGRDRGG